MPQKYQLKNGLKVLLIESKKSPVVAVQMWVKTGSADESQGVEGISHFIEHLVFKGSEKFKVGEMAQAIEGAGGVLNAYTTFDQTVFYVTLSKAFADTGLEVISEMMGRPRFDESEINNEREVVIEEIKRSLDSPHQQASRLLFSTVYQKHPYGVPVIGYDDNIRRISREQIVQYYRQRYVPQNMNLVVVGDFDPKEMKKKIEKFFGSFKKFKLTKVVRKIEPKQKKQRLAVRKAEFSESFLHISWPTVPTRHRDAMALSVLAIVLGQGESSRLVGRIKNEKHLVNAVGTGVFQAKEPGFFSISATLKKERVQAVLEAIQEEISQFILSGPTEEELSKAVRWMESEKFYSMETVDGLAGLYGHFEFLFNDFKYFDKVLREAERLTTRRIREVARKYLKPSQMNISFLTEKNHADAELILEQWAKSFTVPPGKKNNSALKKRNKKSGGFKIKISSASQSIRAKKIILPSGTRLLFKPLIGSTVVSLRVGFLGGLRAESTLGITELASRVWPASSQSMTEAALNSKIESMASGFGAFGGRNSLGLSLTALTPNLKETFSVLEEVLLRPHFDSKIIHREKQLMLEHIKSRGDKPSQKCMRHFMAEMFEGHPYSHDPYGGEKEIPQLNAPKLEEYISRVVRSPNMVVSIAGDVDMRAWEKKIDQLTRKLSQADAEMSSWSLPDLCEDKVYEEHLEKEQTHMAFGYRGLRLNDPNRYVLEVMQSILSGQGGRLFVELRDKASLAYTVVPIRMDGIEPGYFGAYIGCSPEKSEKALKMIQAEFHRLAEIPVSDEEIKRATRYLVGKHDIALQRTGHVADSMLFDELYGLPFDEFESYHENLATVTADKIRDLARQIFSQKYVLSKVGPKTGQDRKM